MPSPNSSPATAIELGPALPNSFSTVIDHITFAWYKYTAQPGDNVVGIFVSRASLNAFFEVYEGLAAANAQSPVYLNSSVTNRPCYFPVTVGNVYYIGITASAGSNITFDIAARRHTDAAVPVGSIVVGPDYTGYPATALSDSGTLLSFETCGASESIEVLKSGTFCTSEEATPPTRLVKIYDKNFNPIFSGAWADWTNGRLSVSGNKLNKFYIGTRLSPFKVTTISNAGVFGPTTWTLPSAMGAIAVNAAESILYWNNANKISRWDLVNNIALSDLAVVIASYSLSDILILDNDNILANYTNFATGDIILRCYNSLGATVWSQTIAGFPVPNSGHRMAHGDFATYVWLWVHPTFEGLSGTFQKRSAVDGSLISSFTAPTFDNGILFAPATATPTAYFGHDESCDFFATASLATITVQKVVVGANASFDFTGPSGAYSLSHGGSQVFEVVPGTYSVVETAKAGYSTTYNVSNGDPHTAIEVAGGDSVTIIVTNTEIVAPPNPGSGIYKITPGKRYDTLWNDDLTGTVDEKIPNPTVRLPYLGG